MSEDFAKKSQFFKNNYPDLDVNWHDPRDYHITLVPPWMTEKLEEVEKILQTTSQNFTPFQIQISNIEFFPNSKPRNIWASVKKSKNLEQLKNEVSQLLADKNITKIENREFKPHITLARFSTSKFKSFSIRKVTESIDHKAQINSFEMIESVDPEEREKIGHRYKIIKSFPFKT